jgi:DNA-binding MarR family transcriptional regulator
MAIPSIGERFRGSGGNVGYLLRQASYRFRGAMDAALRPYGLTAPQYAVLSVLRQEPGASGADLARACNTTAQAMNGVLVTLERAGLVGRSPHPTHGRILQADLTEEGRRRLDAATPAVRDLEEELERDIDADALVAIKRWLVECARRSEDYDEGPDGR